MHKDAQKEIKRPDAVAPIQSKMSSNEQVMLFGALIKELMQFRCKVSLKQYVVAKRVGLFSAKLNLINYPPVVRTHANISLVKNKKLNKRLFFNNNL